MDTAFKSVHESSANSDGLLFQFVEARCGSLPCPPYGNDKELSCAVCTKWCTTEQTLAVTLLNA